MKIISSKASYRLVVEGSTKFATMNWVQRTRLGRGRTRCYGSMKCTLRVKYPYKANDHNWFLYPRAELDVNKQIFSHIVYRKPGLDVVSLEEHHASAFFLEVVSICTDYEKCHLGLISCMKG